MQIAVIDDGINNGYYNAGKLLYDFEITPDLHIIERKFNNPYCNNHGTTCAAIIKKYYGKAEFASIKILDDSFGVSTASQLITAINWCVERKIKLINLSLGTTDYRDFDSIKKCVNTAADKGTVIIAAGCNNNIISYPAFLSNVIGVRQNSGLYGKDGYIMFNSPVDGIDCEACGEHCLIDYRGKERITSPSNSYSAPYITAAAACILENNCNAGISEVKAFLQDSILNHSADRYKHILYRRADWIEKALVFCFDSGADKSIYKDCVGFKADIFYVESVKDCFTYIYSLLNLNELLMNYDTVIIVDSECILNRADGCSLLLHRLEQLNTNLVYLNAANSVDLKSMFGKKLSKIKIWHKYIDDSNVSEECKCLFPIPVIKIIDDGSGQHNVIAAGLRQKFCVNGYFAVSIAYSCEGILFGSEYVFPRGEYEIKRYQKKLYDIYKPDILIIHFKSTERDFGLLNQIIDADVNICVESSDSEISMAPFFKDAGNTVFYNYSTENADINPGEISTVEKLYECIYNMLRD